MESTNKGRLHCPRLPELSARGFWLCVAAVVLVKCVLTSFQMAYTWVGGAPLDDELMFRAANAISSGEWLGAYDYLTLSKSMFFAVWLAFLNVLHLPYLVSGQFLWCAASLLAALAFRPWLRHAGRGRWAEFAVFAVLAFNPASTAAYTLRVYRDNIFPALCLICFAGFCGALLRAIFAPDTRRWPWLLAAGAGLVTGYLDREDAGLFLLPFAALATVAGEQFDPVDVALKAQQAEREYAGVNCGIMDQYAAACGKKDNAILLDCNTLEREYIPLKLGEYSLVIINSNKPHSLVESRYNERRAETDEAFGILKKYAAISCLADLSADEFQRLGHLLPATLRNRVRHVVEECNRVNIAAEAMRVGDMVFLGRLLNKSHKSLSELYEVTGREMDALAYAAQSHPACAGSRMIGGGFGGSTISIVRTSGISDFISFVLEKYNRATGLVAESYTADISDGITVEKIQ